MAEREAMAPCSLTNQGELGDCTSVELVQKAFSMLYMSNTM